MSRPRYGFRNHSARIAQILARLYRQWAYEKKNADIVSRRDYIAGVVFGLNEAVNDVRRYRKTEGDLAPNRAICRFCYRV